MSHRIVMIACLALVVCASNAAAQESLRAWSPFVIPAEPPEDAVIAFRGEPIAIDSPRVVVRDGHFFVNDRRLRVWGVNLSYGANFPSHADATRIAKRLEAFGVNSVRFHHMDMEYFRFPQSIWDAEEPTKLSEEALDRLDYFIDQLARRGIWSNLNLHVSRTHSRHLGLPDTKATGSYDKIVNLFTPRLIEAQKDYARRLLTRVNKYRHVAYAADPAIAFVEINNEDSFFMWDAEVKMREMDPFYADILQAKYNDWLKARHGTTEALAAVWKPTGGKTAEADAIDLPFKDANRAWRAVAVQGAVAALADIEPAAARLEIANPGKAAWHVEVMYDGVRLAPDRQYEITLRARAEAPRDVVVTVRQGHEPWGTLGLRRNLKLSNEWQEFTLPFQPPAAENDARVSFLAGQSNVNFEIADVRLHTRPLIGLGDNESLERGDIRLFLEGESPARIESRMRFLAETEKAYFDDFKSFIRSHGCDALVTGTMVYGFLGLWAQSDMDYIDNHTYWAHPQFPAGWSASNWTIEQKAFVEHSAEGKIHHDMATRLAGKPLTVSEYSHPAPGDYQAEGIPLIASVAAAQDWDGVWHFGYADKADDWNAGAFDGFFNIHANPAKWGFMPAGAVIFREGGVSPLAFGMTWPIAKHEDPLVDLIPLQRAYGHAMIDGLQSLWGIGRAAAMRQRIAIAFEGEPTPLPASSDSVTRLELSQGSFDAIGPAARVRIETARASRDSIATDNGFAVLVAAALDGKPLQRSERILITVCGRVENTGMGFSGDRRTVRTNWGEAPVRVESPAVRLAWPTETPVKLTFLNPDATRAASQSLDPVEGEVSLEFPADSGTMWYLLER